MWRNVGLIHIINALCWPPAFSLPLSIISWASSVRAAFLLPEGCLCISFVSAGLKNVCFILKHLMLKEAVQQDWSVSPVDIKLWALTSLPVKWPGAVGLPCLVFLVAVVPVKTPLKWKLLSFCRLLLGLFRFVFVSVVSFHLLTHAWVGSFSLLFGVHMALGLTPQVVLWLHSLLSLWAPVLCDCLVAATPLLLFWTFFFCSIVPSNFECFYTSGDIQ